MSEYRAPAHVRVLYQLVVEGTVIRTTPKESEIIEEIKDPYNSYMVFKDKKWAKHQETGQ